MGDDEQPGGGERVRRQLEQDSGYSQDAFRLMENALDKLKILDYEREYCARNQREPFTATYFALPPPPQMSGIQVQTFFDLVSWLMEEATGDAGYFNIDKYDDPNTSVNKMILALKNMDFALDAPANKLKQGFGEAVCSVLDFLTDRALANRNFSWGRPIHPDEGFADDVGADDDAEVDDVDDEIDDDVDAVQEDDGMFSEIAARDNNSALDTSLDNSRHEILQATVDPLDWKTELERVGPRLRVNMGAGSGNEWRAHIDQTRQHEATISQVLPVADTQLRAMSTDVSETLERLRTKERSINNQFEELRMEYQQVRSSLTEVEARHSERSSRVNELTNQLAAIQDQLQGVKDTMGERGASMTDTSPLQAIKKALTQIKSEIKTFDIRVGVVAHSLLSKMRVAKTDGDSGKDPDDDGEHVDFDISDDEGGVF